jgi:hypothetical protein
MEYFLEDDCAMLTLSDSENESDDEEIPDLGKNMLIEPDVVDSSAITVIRRNGAQQCHLGRS